IRLTENNYAQTCHRAEYRVGQECCPMCPPGNRVNKHCTEFTSTSCEPCADGTFLDQLNGQTECFPCKTCDAGLKVKRPCTTTSDAVCGPQDGFFCVDRRGDGCVAAQKHRSCKAGQYISRRAITDTECSDCTGETYSNGTFPSCQPHTKCESEGLQQIRPGNHAADSECGPKHDSSNKTVIIVPVILVAVIIVAVAVAAAVMCRRNKRPKQKTRSYSYSLSFIYFRSYSLFFIYFRSYSLFFIYLICNLWILLKNCEFP
uniref:TNFR-Cys domain-containing protein n=1 Tax=Myripristis murdjan TaxID=586833 RepID=A0A667WHI9_9TELE